jgi:hypothetical protein
LIEIRKSSKDFKINELDVSIGMNPMHLAAAAGAMVKLCFFDVQE